MIVSRSKVTLVTKTGSPLPFIGFPYRRFHPAGLVSTVRVAKGFREIDVLAKNTLFAPIVLKHSGQHGGR
jgi:hypothetical protein